MTNVRRQQSPEQRAALDRAFRAEQRRGWLRRAAIAFVACVGAGLFVWFTTGQGSIIDRNQMSGTVLQWTRSQSYTGTSGLFITVQLADGRKIVARSSETLAPKANARITVQENVYEGGARSFVWPVGALR